MLMFCVSKMCFVVLGVLFFVVILCISLVMFLMSVHLFPYTRVNGLFRDDCSVMFGFMFLIWGWVL